MSLPSWRAQAGRHSSCRSLGAASFCSSVPAAGCAARSPHERRRAFRTRRGKPVLDHHAAGGRAVLPPGSGRPAVRLIFASTGGYGHVIPLVPLAVAARGAGHDVAFATEHSFRSALSEVDLDPIPAGITVRDAIGTAAREA